MLEAAGYTKPVSSGTSTTVSECINRMPLTLVSPLKGCMYKIRMQKKSYLSPYETSRLKDYQEMERKNVQKKKLPKLSQKKATVNQTKQKSAAKSIPGVPSAMQGMMSNFIAGKSEYNDPEIAQSMSDIYSRKSSNSPAGSSQGSSNCQTKVYSTTVGGTYQQGKKTTCN